MFVPFSGFSILGSLTSAKKPPRTKLASRASPFRTARRRMTAMDASRRCMISFSGIVLLTLVPSCLSFAAVPLHVSVLRRPACTQHMHRVAAPKMVAMPDEMVGQIGGDSLPLSPCDPLIDTTRTTHLTAALTCLCQSPMSVHSGRNGWQVCSKHAF